jgi:hypothetical protein
LVSGRTDSIITVSLSYSVGHSQPPARVGCPPQIDKKVAFETFFAQAPQINPNVSKTTGVICGYSRLLPG